MRLDLSSLPPIIRDCIRIAGLDAALKLVDCYGGTRVWFPDRLDADHHLVRNLGDAAARALCAYFTLDNVTIPRCARTLRATRDADIVEMLNQGCTQAEAARKHRLTERQVANIAARARHKIPHPDLFDIFN